MERDNRHGDGAHIHMEDIPGIDPVRVDSSCLRDDLRERDRLLWEGIEGVHFWKEDCENVDGENLPRGIVYKSGVLRLGDEEDDQ